MIKITLLDIVIKIALIGKDLVEIHICKCNDENYLDRKYLISFFSTEKKPCTIKWACTLNSIRNIIRPVCLLGAVRLIDIGKKSNLYAYLQLYVYSGLKSTYVLLQAAKSMRMTPIYQHFMGAFNKNRQNPGCWTVCRI